MDCLNFCLNAYKTNIGSALDDQMIMIASEILENEESISELRKDRWQWASLAYNKAGNVIIKILDDVAFSNSCDSETKILGQIARQKAIFVQLNPIFEIAEQKLKFFSVPTIKGLESHRQKTLNHIFKVEERLRNDASDRLSSARSRGQTVEAILSDPGYLSHKAELEAVVTANRAEVEVCDELISRAEAVLQG